MEDVEKQPQVPWFHSGKVDSLPESRMKKELSGLRERLD
jgi:hypothetical protein